jgi:hypothetical protein
MVPVPHIGRLSLALTVGAALVFFGACTEKVSEPPGERPELEAAGVSAPRVPKAALRVSREEFSRTIAPHLSRSGDGLKIERTPSGSSRIDHEGRFRSVHVATRGPDGKPHVQCVTSKAELDALLAKGAR